MVDQLEEARATFRRLRAAVAFPLATDPADPDLVAERTRLIKEQADAVAMDNETRRGQVVEVAAVVRAVEAECSQVRNRLLAIPAEQAARLVRIKTPVEMQEAMHEIIFDALTELSGKTVPGMRAGIVQ